MATDVGNNSFFDDFLDDYFAECEEHLTAVRRNMLALETFVGQSPISRSLLDELLRSFHSLKGLSGMVGVKNAEQLSHEMESYLRDLRSEEIKLSVQGMDALVSGTKMLEQVIEKRRTATPAPDIAQVLSQLAAVIKTEPPDPDLSSAPSPSPAIPSASLTRAIVLKPEESQRLSEALDKGAKAWHFEFVPAADRAAKGIDVNAIRERLQSIGQLIQASPRIKGEGAIVFDFIVASDEDESIFASWRDDGLTCVPWISQEGEKEEHGSRGEGEHGSRGAREQGSRGARERGRGGAREHGSRGARERGSTGAREHGSTGEGEHGSTGAREHGSRGEEERRRGGEEEEKGESFPATVPLSPSATVPLSSTVTPSNLVRVDLSRLDELMRIVGELVTTRARLEDRLKRLDASIGPQDRRSLAEINQKMERQVRDLRSSVMRVRLVPIGDIFARMQFVVRDLAREAHKKVALELSGQQTEIDKYVVERMMDPLLHLVRNAVSHGIESEDERRALGKPAQGKLALRASAAGEMVTIEIQDDGRGVDVARAIARARTLGLIESDSEELAAENKNEEILPQSSPVNPSRRRRETISPLGGQGGSDAIALLDILCAPGFSTREQADLTSGRGVGMAIVQNTVQELGGSLSMETFSGMGTRFTIQLPLTLFVTDALIVSVAFHTYAVPQSSVIEVLEVQPTAITLFENNEIISYRGSTLPIIRLARLFGLAEEGEEEGRRGREKESTPLPFSPLPSQQLHVLVIGMGSKAVGITVDRLFGLREIVVRPLADPLVKVPGIAGATELGDGRLVLILDCTALLKISQFGNNFQRAKS